MRRGIIIAIIGTLIISAPAIAAGPLVGFVVDYVKKQITERATSFVKQKAMDAISPSGMPAVGMAGMSLEQQAAAAKMSGFMKNQYGAAAGMPALPPEAAAAMQQYGFGNPNAKVEPLTDKEIDELARRMEKMAQQNPSQGKFDVAQFKQTLKNQPQMAPMMRGLAGTLAQVEKGLEEARNAYAKMSPEEQNEVVQQLVVESKKMPAEERATFAAALQGNFFGLPDDLKAKTAAALR